MGAPLGRSVVQPDSSFDKKPSAHRGSSTPFLITNVELVRLGFELFEREGPASFQSLLVLADPEIECYAAPGIEPSGRYHGRDAALRWWEGSRPGRTFRSVEPAGQGGLEPPTSGFGDQRSTS